jgi:hypothetical protein
MISFSASDSTAIRDSSHGYPSDHAVTTRGHRQHMASLDLYEEEVLLDGVSASEFEVQEP